MNKSIIFSVIAFAIVALLGISFFQAAPLKNIHITKEVTIKADKSEVFDMVRYLENFPKWSPFLAEDPGQKYEVKGTDGEVGAQYHWVGNGGKDVGFQEIVKVEEGKYIGMRCDIQKPFKATPTFEYTFTETPDGIVVRQDFKLQSKFVDAFFMWLFGAKKDMANMNEKGLQLLKKALQKNA